jgi:transposase
MDNASFHKRGRIKELIEQAECEILYLPPYSPDLNPIEHHWAPIKTKMRHYLLLMESVSFKSVCWFIGYVPEMIIPLALLTRLGHLSSPTHFVY